MHKLFWATAALALSITAAQAQDNKTAVPVSPAIEQAPVADPTPGGKRMVKDPAVRAKAMTERITNTYSLNPQQSEKVYAAFLNQFTQVEALKDQQGEVKDRVKAIRQDTDTRLKEAMGAENFAKYEASRKEMREERHARKGTHGAK